MRLNHRLTNIRQNDLYSITSEMIKREPSFICLEDLNVKGMRKNRQLSKAVQQQGFYEFRRQMEYNCIRNNIPVVIADRFFPSSKLCSCCGTIKKDLKLSERIYKGECGNVMDRDYQAVLNLKNMEKCPCCDRQDNTFQLIQIGTDTLVRNLRLWSVVELVSSI